MPTTPIRWTLPALMGPVLVVLGAVGASADAPKPPAIPATIAVELDAAPAAPGDAVAVVVRLTPIAGVKLNRYPKMSLRVPAQSGVVGAVAVERGAESPPRPGSQASNYWEEDSVALELALEVDDSAAGGDYRVGGRLQYFYCVVASGFCSRESVDVVIPLAVR